WSTDIYIIHQKLFDTNRFFFLDSGNGQITTTSSCRINFQSRQAIHSRKNTFVHSNMLNPVKRNNDSSGGQHPASVQQIFFSYGKPSFFESHSVNPKQKTSENDDKQRSKYIKQYGQFFWRCNRNAYESH